MPKILHVTTVPASLLFLRGQPALMRARGVEIVVATAPGEALERFAEEEGVRAHAVPMARKITPAEDLATLARLWQIIQRERPDVVHAHTPKGGLLGTLAALLAGVPVRIYHMRGLPLVGLEGARRALLTLTERVSCAAATHVVAVSHGLRRDALRFELCAPDKLRVLGHGSGQGVDVARFDPERLAPDTRSRVRAAADLPEGATVVGYVGRLVNDKGVRELAAAWRRLRAAHPDVHLVIVGAFEERDRVPADVRSTLEDDPRVHLLGFRRDLPELYAAMDVVVLPSYREGFPNVPLEAAAMRLPIVGTHVTGMDEAIDDQLTGLLVPPRDARSLEAAIERYLVDPELRARHGRAGRERVTAKFARADVLGHLSRFYREVAPSLERLG